MDVNDFGRDWDEGCYNCGGRKVAGACVRRCHEDPDPIQEPPKWSEPKVVAYESEWGLQAYRYCWNQPDVDKWSANARLFGHDPVLLSVEEVRKREHEDRPFKQAKARDLWRSQQARKRASLAEFREVIE